MRWDTVTVLLSLTETSPESMGKNAITIRCDGHGVPEILDAILKLFPLDTYVEHPVNLMEVMPGDNVETPIWDNIKKSF